MTGEPTPPPEGWSLREAAAALFPKEWIAANLPDDDREALAHPGVSAPNDPLAGLPLDRMRQIIAASVDGSSIALLSAEDAALVERNRAYQADAVRRLAEARKAAERARASLPRLFADRMLRGDLVAYGVHPRAALDALPAPIRPHLWAAARPHFGFDEPERFHVAPGRTRLAPTPEPDSVSGLPGNVVLRGVRVRSTRSTDRPASTANASNPTTSRVCSAAVATKIDQPVVTTTKKASTRNKGGHPKRDDWPLFNKRASHLLALDGGNLTRRQFRKQMKEWAAMNMRPAPDDRTIDRYIDANFDTTVFAPE